MKKLLFAFISLVLVMASCAEEENMGLKGEQITFTLTPDTEVLTRSASGLSRYIMEVYQGNDLSVEPILHKEQAAGTFAIKLDPSLDYTCLFWADAGTPDQNSSGCYNATSLLDVNVNADKVMTEAFFAKYNMAANSTADHNVSLKRGVAQINLMATDVIEANAEIEATLNGYTKFNVSNGEVLGTVSPLIQTFNITAGTGKIATFLSFASVSGITTDISFLLEGTIKNDITGIPLQANYLTNIIGKFSLENYTFVTNPDENWDDNNTNITQGYYKEGTYEGQGVKIDGLWWAPVNVGYTEAEPYGLLFNWGKNVGFSYDAIQSATDGNWTESDQGPCPEGWRIPTAAEYSVLMMKTPDHESGGYIGRDGSVHPNDFGGRWYGPDCLTATVTTPGRSVFFPNFKDGLPITWINEWALSCYWNSTSSGGSFAFCCCSYGVRASPVGWPFSVRCVSGPMVFPTVKIAKVTNIQTVSVTLNGEVSSNGGTEIIERGFIFISSSRTLKYDVSIGSYPIPTVENGNKVISELETGIGSYTSILSGLTPGTNYVVTAYAINNHGISYGENRSFTTFEETVDSPTSGSGYYKTETYEGQGVKIDALWWAPVNVGYTAENPYGLLFNWGKNEGFEYGGTGQSAGDGSWSVHDQGPCPQGWRVPTKAEFSNLLLVNSPVGTTRRSPGQWRAASANNPNSLAGTWFGSDCRTATVATPGNSVFFPAAGNCSGSIYKEFKNKDLCGYYWTSHGAAYMGSYLEGIFVSFTSKSLGVAVRCVQN